jgi:hypothetical protein
MAERLPEEAAIRVVVEGVPERWTGRRDRVVLDGRAAIVAHARRFRLNAIPQRSLRR